MGVLRVGVKIRGPRGFLGVLFDRRSGGEMVEDMGQRDFHSPVNSITISSRQRLSNFVDKEVE